MSPRRLDDVLRNITDTPSKQATWAPRLIRMSDVQPERVSWLWDPFLPIGKLTFLEGDPGLGKTWLALAIAATVTLGKNLPGHLTTAGPRPVLYYTAEDGLGDTLRPRLDAVGADVTLVHALQGKVKPDDEGGELSAGFTLADVPVLRDAIEQTRPTLVVLDPLSAVIGADVDANKANEVRPRLAALAELAQEYMFAAVIIRHLRKASADRAVHKGQGSIDFAAAARSIILVGEDPQDETKRVMAHVKSSLARLGPSLAFEIREGAFYWLGASETTADQLLAPRLSREERTLTEEAAEWLTELLKDGPVSVNEVKLARRSTDFSEATLRVAKERLGIESARVSSGNRGAGAWSWSLPNREREEPPRHTETSTLPTLPRDPLESALSQDASNESTSTLQTPRDNRQNPQGSQGASTPLPRGLDLTNRAAHFAERWTNLSPEKLTIKLEVAQEKATAAPTWWRTAALTDLLPVVIASVMLGADQEAGTYPGTTNPYLQAARNAVAALKGHATAPTTLTPPPGAPT